MGENPQHNRHIIEQADAIEAAFNENNQQMMVLFREMSRRLDKLEADMEALKKIVETHTKNVHSRGYRAHASVSAANAGKHPERIKLISGKLWRGSHSGKPAAKPNRKPSPPHTQREQTTPVAVPSFFIPFRRFRGQ